MFTWLKKLFGLEAEEVVVPAPTPVVEKPKVEPPKVEEPVVEKKAEPAPKAKATATKSTKKTSTKKSGGKCDFDKLTKKQLLAEAKHRGVKANASLSKAEILKRLKANG